MKFFNKDDKTNFKNLAEIALQKNILDQLKDTNKKQGKNKVQHILYSLPTVTIKNT